jgi:crotonobetainyl-CoA:carnitine CoA-transferase CaiB-like acyl-CoA transferase
MSEGISIRRTKMSRALEGITVLDLSRLLPGPYCSSILANYGADVICIEDRRYEPEPHMDMLYVNKRHMVLNLKTNEAKEIFYALAEKADVVIEQFRPGVVKSLGVDYESLRKMNPRLIYCSITGYGQYGPYKNMVGHDVNYLGFSGVLSLIGEKNGVPRIPGIQIGDIAGGGMNAAIGILIALAERERSGEGQYIDISMADGMIGLLTLPLHFYFEGNQAPEKSNMLLSHRYASYNVYETADSKYICIGTLEPRFWIKLCNHLSVPEYCDHQYDDDRREEIINFMQQTFKKKTRNEWMRELGELDVCFAPVLSLDEVIRDKHFLEREMFTKLINKNNEEIPLVGFPIKLSRTPGSYVREPDKFGASTHTILKELGYSEEEIGHLAQKGVI